MLGSCGRASLGPKSLYPLQRRIGKTLPRACFHGIITRGALHSQVAQMAHDSVFSQGRGSQSGARHEKLNAIQSPEKTRALLHELPHNAAAAGSGRTAFFLVAIAATAVV